VGGQIADAAFGESVGAIARLCRRQGIPATTAVAFRRRLARIALVVTTAAFDKDAWHVRHALIAAASSQKSGGDRRQRGGTRQVD
jgi:hypothetical protein